MTDRPAGNTCVTGIMPPCSGPSPLALLQPLLLLVKLRLDGSNGAIQALDLQHLGWQGDAAALWSAGALLTQQNRQLLHSY